MSSQPRPTLTADEYLVRERISPVRHQFYQGDVFAMAGASRRHNLIVGNLVRTLGNALVDTACEIYPTDMRVRVEKTGLYTYPAVTIVCEDPQFEDDHLDTLINPLLIIEVLSDTTEQYDRGKKFGHYRQLDSLAVYLLAAQEEPRVEQFVRQPEGNWLLSEAVGRDASIVIPAINCPLELADVYAKVSFED